MSLQKLIKLVDGLSKRDQDCLFEILLQRRMEAREAEILANLQELKEAISTGTAKTGTVEDLIADLNED